MRAKSATTRAERNAVIDTPEINSIASMVVLGRIFHSKCGTDLAPADSGNIFCILWFGLRGDRYNRFSSQSTEE
jgi:hypothetical protein